MLLVVCICLTAFLWVEDYRGAVRCLDTYEDKFKREIREAAYSLVSCLTYLAVATPLLMLFSRYFAAALTTHEALSLLGTVPLVASLWLKLLQDGISSRSMVCGAISLLSLLCCMGLSLFAISIALWKDADASILAWLVFAAASVIVLFISDLPAGYLAPRLVRLGAWTVRRFGYGKKAAINAIDALTAAIDELASVNTLPENVRRTLAPRLSGARGAVNLAREKAALYQWSDAAHIATQEMKDVRVLRKAIHYYEACEYRDADGECRCYDN